jgi:hypothetical protein
VEVFGSGFDDSFAWVAGGAARGVGLGGVEGGDGSVGDFAEGVVGLERVG